MMLNFGYLPIDANLLAHGDAHALLTITTNHWIGRKETYV
jgi:hypothetical protein